MNQGIAVAVVLARGGSKGVCRKNLVLVGGLSLVARSVIAARQARSVSATYVSTDDAAIAQEALIHGAYVIDRPPELAGDQASSESGWLHALGEIRKAHPTIDRLVLLQCTSPFTSGIDIDGCLAAIDATGAACSASVIEDHAFLWTRGSDGFGKGVNHDESTQRRRRQELPNSYRESGAIYCVRVDAFEQIGRRFCGSVALYPVDHPSIEIDTPADLAICDAIVRSDLCLAEQKSINERLAEVKALVMDFDGVHTDDTVTVDSRGVESVTVSRRDGMGIELLRKRGYWDLMILSKEKNPVVLRRAEKLSVQCLSAVDDKVAALDPWLIGKHLKWKDVLYVGNDLNDVGPITMAGVSASPCDASPAILPLVDWIIPVRGGCGAVRAVADRLLNVRMTHDALDREQTR